MHVVYEYDKKEVKGQSLMGLHELLFFSDDSLSLIRVYCIVVTQKEMNGTIYKRCFRFQSAQLYEILFVDQGRLHK